jgi:hypothetical protein
MVDINIVYLLIGVLATFRLTNLLWREVGPFKVLVWIRERFGVVHDHLGFPHGYPDTMWGKLFECNWCLSVWVGTAVAIVLLVGGWWLLLPFALSAGSLICVRVAVE